MKLGLAISTRNRYDTFKGCYDKWIENLPDNCELVVVDDASDTPVPEATYRFKERAGIARVKNKCLELLMNKSVDSIFLADDDCYPLNKGWWKPYINHPEPHLMAIFTAYGGQTRLVKELYRDDKTVAYDHVRGYFLYFDRKCIERVGGFDTAFGNGYYEHRDLTERIHRAGLTSHLIMDIPNSDEYIYSMDCWEEVESTFTPAERFQLLRQNRRIRKQSIRKGLWRDYAE